MSTFLYTSISPVLDIYILRRDFFDGFTLLLQDEDGLPLDFSETQVRASIWKRTASGTTEQITAFNVQEQEPLRNGQARLWLTAAQTAAVWDAALEIGSSAISQAFFPNAYLVENKESTIELSPIIWDVRIKKQEEASALVSVTNGSFITQTSHGLGATDGLAFIGTANSSINYTGTGPIFSDLTNISYTPPYSFTVPSLSGITDAAIGGSVYRLKQDTVAAGTVFVGSTFTNFFS